MSVQNFSQRMKHRRQALGLNLREVAVRIGVPESTYRDWENGKGLRVPPFDRISRELAISVTDLLVGHTPELTAVTDELELIEKRLLQLRLNLISRI